MARPPPLRGAAMWRGYVRPAADVTYHDTINFRTMSGLVLSCLSATVAGATAVEAVTSGVKPPHHHHHARHRHQISERSSRNATSIKLFESDSHWSIVQARAEQFAELRKNAWLQPESFRDEVKRAALSSAAGENTLPLATTPYAWRLWRFSSVELSCERPPGASCLGAAVVLRDRHRRLQNAVAGDSGRVAVQDAFWFSYASNMQQFHHFMCEWLPNLAFLLATAPPSPLRTTALIVDDWALRSIFVRDALTTLGLSPSAMRTVPRSGLVVNGDLLLPQKLAYLFGAVAYPGTRLLHAVHQNAALAAAALASDPMAATSTAAASTAAASTAAASTAARTAELVFIDRLDAPKVAGKRQLINGPALSAALRARGFVTISTSELSFAARVRALARARVVLMLAGTSQINSLFVPRGALVVVIAHPLGSSVKWNTLWYAWLCADAVGACKTIMLNNTLVDHSKARPLEPWRVDYRVDLPPLLAELDAITSAITSAPAQWPPTSRGAHCQQSCDVDAWGRGRPGAGRATLGLDQPVQTCALHCWRDPHAPLCALAQRGCGGTESGRARRTFAGGARSRSDMNATSSCRASPGCCIRHPQACVGDASGGGHMVSPAASRLGR